MSSCTSSSSSTTTASDGIFSHYSVSSYTESEPVSVKKTVSTPAAQKYESEIEKCIRAGLIDCNMPRGPGLPPLPAFNDFTATSRRSSSSASTSTSLSRQRTIDDLPLSRRPSDDVVGGLQKLAIMLQSCTGRTQCSIKEDINGYWDDLSTVGGSQVEDGGRHSQRHQLCEDRDARRRHRIDTKKVRDRYLDQWLVGLDEQHCDQARSTMLLA